MGLMMWILVIKTIPYLFFWISGSIAFGRGDAGLGVGGVAVYACSNHEDATSIRGLISLWAHI